MKFSILVKNAIKSVVRTKQGDHIIRRIRMTPFWRARTRHHIKRQITAKIAAKYDAPIDVHANSNYEGQWMEYEKKYDEIVFARYYMRRIGEMCLTYHFLTEETNDCDKVKYVMYPLTFHENLNEVPNRVLYEKIRKNIELIDEVNGEFWLWVLKNKKEKIRFTEAYEPMYLRECSMKYPWCSTVLGFTPEEECVARKAMKDMSLREPFVCLYTRDNAYYVAIEQNSGTEAQISARNSSINQMYFTADRLAEEGMQSVRMGSVVEGESNCRNLIDYASQFQNELMDLYLIAKCKFFAVSGSGIQLIGTLFNKPLLLHNMPHLSFGGDMVTPLSPERDIILLKKIRCEKENRYLTLREILHMESKYRDYNLFDKYVSAGCKFIDNTPEEIWDAANELNQRLDGRKSYTKKEMELRKRYLEIVEATTKENNVNFYNAMYSTKFLVDNPWFLA